MPRWINSEITAIQPHQDVFGAPAESLDPGAGQPRGQAFGKRPAHVGPRQRRAHDPPALQARPQPAHHRLDLGEFRHGWRARYTWARMSDNPAPQADTADFGYRTVPRAAKQALVRGVFERVAPRYDLMNDLMSLGVHRAWKRIFLRALDPRPQYQLLDLAAGTGDIGLGWRQSGGGPALLSDVNPAMLSRARDRALDRGIARDIGFVVADAEALPLPDRCVDRVSIAFGLRNCTDKPAVLAEARRVLRPGGRFFCLEFSRFQVAALLPAYDAWSFRMLPLLGRVVAGRSGELSIPGRKHPDLPVPGRTCGDAARSRLRPRGRPQPLRRHRGDP